jgi:hypothetical protein
MGRTPAGVTSDGLIGKCFHIFGGDGKVARQGRVVAVVGPSHYLVQYFDWALGEPNTMAVVSVETMAVTAEHERKPGSWQFYEDADHMNRWYETWGGGERAKSEAADMIVPPERGQEQTEQE